MNECILAEDDYSAVVEMDEAAATQQLHLLMAAGGGGSFNYEARKEM